MNERDKMLAAFLAGSLRPSVSMAHAERSFAQWYDAYRKASKPVTKNPTAAPGFCNPPRVMKRAS